MVFDCYPALDDDDCNSLGIPRRMLGGQSWSLEHGSGTYRRVALAANTRCHLLLSMVCLPIISMVACDSAHAEAMKCLNWIATHDSSSSH